MKPERTPISSAPSTLCCFALVFVRSGVYVYHPQEPSGQSVSPVVGCI